MDKILLTEIEELKTIINILKWIIVFGAITFFASHLTIITQLPKIRRLFEAMYLNTEEKEKQFREKQFKEDMSFLLRFAIYGAIIGIFIICLFL